MSRIREEAAMIRSMWDKTPFAEMPKGARYRTALDLVDAEGVEFTPEPGTPEIMGPMKQCYKNAGGLVLFDPDQRYVYCEGFAVLSAEIPLAIAHAWVWDAEEGKAIEVTWENPGIEYLGIAFDTTWFRAWTQATEYWGVLDRQIMLTEQAKPEKYTHERFRKKASPGG